MLLTEIESYDSATHAVLLIINISIWHYSSRIILIERIAKYSIFEDNIMYYHLLEEFGRDH